MSMTSFAVFNELGPPARRWVLGQHRNHTAPEGFSSSYMPTSPGTSRGHQRGPTRPRTNTMLSVQATATMTGPTPSTASGRLSADRTPSSSGQSRLRTGADWFRYSQSGPGHARSLFGAHATRSCACSVGHDVSLRGFRPSTQPGAVHIGPVISAAARRSGLPAVPEGGSFWHGPGPRMTGLMVLCRPARRSAPVPRPTYRDP